MRTPKRSNPKRPESRSIKIQPKFRKNEYEMKRVPELRLSGNWLEKLGFELESRVTIHTSKGLLVIRPAEYDS